MGMQDQDFDVGSVNDCNGMADYDYSNGHHIRQLRSETTCSCSSDFNPDMHHTTRLWNFSILSHICSSTLSQAVSLLL